MEPYHALSVDEVRENRYGFCVRIGPAGSITQSSFNDYAMHFVANLPESQGVNGEPVLLFLNGHSSWWDISSLLFLLKSSIFHFPPISHIHMNGTK